MAAYKVVESFADLKDGGRVYRPGDEYPRAGLDVSDARLAELASASNKLGKPLIVKNPDEVPEAPTQAPQGATEGEEMKPKAKTTRKKKAAK